MSTSMRQEHLCTGGLLRIKPPNMAVISYRYVPCELHKAIQFAIVDKIPN